MILKDGFRSFISQTNREGRLFVTLGPDGTSSKQAAEVLTRQFPAQVRLFSTYEEAAEAVGDDPTNRALIVANAYAAINRFYISHELFPAAAFFNDTPAYVIAARSARELEREQITIASHPAPRHLIEATLKRPGIEVLETVSTHRAAELAVDGLADACLTTQTAAEMLGLQSLITAFPAIPMLWTVFISKDHKEWRQKALLSSRKNFRSDSRPILQL